MVRARRHAGMAETSWQLRGYNGWHPVSIRQCVAACNGGNDFYLERPCGRASLVQQHQQLPPLAMRKLSCMTTQVSLTLQGFSSEADTSCKPMWFCSMRLVRSVFSTEDIRTVRDSESL